MSAALSPAGALDRVMNGFSRWLDLVADAVVGGLGQLGRGPALRLDQQADGSLSSAGLAAADLAGRVKGQAIELRLDPARFLFRPLELPAAAAPFLDGIVRAQIDRLTPWSTTEASFGWSAPEPLPEERIRILVAATAKARMAPVLEQIKALGAGPMAVTVEGADGVGPIRILDPSGGAAAPVTRVRQWLFAVLAATALASAASLVAADVVGGALESEQAAIDAEAASVRRALLAARDGSGPEGAALRLLQLRKREGAPMVLVLEALSRLLPDDTYLTALTVEDGKVQITGLSQDAAALIPLLEQSGDFTAVTFTAPTTQAAGESGEHFEIAAEIRLRPELAP